ncbi:MAG: hypothetical protein HFG34_13135 [Eubacterium sp.]|jgi:hypothetical protein|nr:hypothetical protein [Eubacterium sp.]MCI8719382.1 hypothetical protein [Lachnospiraceae bacterium]MCI8826108.1 hypothetical protein [Lachnospiraceae bacterium]
MNYKMEELLLIVGTLADKYTSFESTSITYEKAQELMEVFSGSVNGVLLRIKNALKNQVLSDIF